VRSTGPLDGIRVMDISSVVMGPYATQIMGDLGADVIKIESVEGDSNRRIGAGPHPELSGTALNLLRNKRSVCLDLKQSDGRQAALRIAATCDVMLTNLRPGPLGRLGLSYDDVRAVRPDIVFCAGHGFPSDSARADDAAYDDAIQASAGIADLIRIVSGAPSFVPTVLTDKLCGLTMLYSICAALLHRERTGEGQRIEVPMHDTTVAFLLAEHGTEAIPVPPLGPPGYKRIMTPHRRPYESRDDWILVLPYTTKQWQDVFALSGNSDGTDDSRLRTRESRDENADTIFRDFSVIMKTKTTAEWVDWCRVRNIACSPVGSMDDIVKGLPEVEHPLAGRHKFIPSPVRFSRTPSQARIPAPLIGEHSIEVLTEVGLNATEIAALKSSGALPYPDR
jgi:crotonobetainyl-CoA:carnitine CoA-transferase CaiB-like acyl-CoA transferase